MPQTGSVFEIEMIIQKAAHVEAGGEERAPRAFCTTASSRTRSQPQNWGQTCQGLDLNSASFSVERRFPPNLPSWLLLWTFVMIFFFFFLAVIKRKTKKNQTKKEEKKMGGKRENSESSVRNILYFKYF